MSTRTATVRLVCLAVLVRLLAMLLLPDALAADLDGYLAFARTWSATGEYASIPGIPSAHRPPGYPLFLLVLERCLPGSLPRLSGIVVGHVTAAALTVALTGVIARQLGAGRYAWVAMGAVALDPLLIRSATLVMTETLFTALFAGMLACWLRHSTVRPTAGKIGWFWRLATGLLLAAAALVRPIAWAVWGVLGAVLFLLPQRRLVSLDDRDAEAGDRACPRGRTNARRRVWAAWCGALAVALIACLPWIARNYLVFGRPILSSTHGGYTLWLGQNPVYYAAVVVGPHKVWPDFSFERWTDGNRDETVGRDEFERDRYFRDQALAWMRDHPGSALRSMTYHVWSLWSPAPRKERPLVRWVCGVFYVAVYLLAAVGLWRAPVWRHPGLILPASLLTFTLVHAVYWSDVRMRAPLIVVLAVLASLGGSQRAGPNGSPSDRS